MSHRQPRPAFVIIGNPGSRRVELFQQALTCCGLPAARLVTYSDLLMGRMVLADVVQRHDVVRIESPGQDWEVEKLLLTLGNGAIQSSYNEGHFVRLSSASIAKLSFDRGRILASRQWYLGWCAALCQLESQLAQCPAHQLMNVPADIAIMFDKVACHERLSSVGIPVPRSLGSPTSFGDLLERMRQSGCLRVFIKLAHGSSAAGVVAYQTNGHRHQATTTTEMVQQEGKLHLYNSRRIHTYYDVKEISDLVDALCRHRVHVEQWMPKAGQQGRTLDLRVVVIAGRAQHTIVRLSHSPLTNLHLLNERAEAATVRSRMSEDAWAATRTTCEKVMGCFPDSLYGGVDLLISPNYRHHAVLEVNAFGDLLSGLLHAGMDTYTAQVRAMLGKLGKVARPELCSMPVP